jgi:hypothetical protein
MRGADVTQEALFSTIKLDDFLAAERADGKGVPAGRQSANSWLYALRNRDPMTRWMLRAAKNPSVSGRLLQAANATPPAQPMT